MYAVDTANNRIQKYDQSGKLILSFGSYGNGDGQFNQPQGIAVDQAGYIYVVDTGNHRVQKLKDDGKSFSFVEVMQELPGAEKLNFPRACKIDPSGDLCVVDTSNNRIIEYSSAEISVLLGGNTTRTMPMMTLNAASFSSTEESFSEPYGSERGADGNLYVADTDNHMIKKYSPSGKLLLSFGGRGRGNGQFLYPYDVTIDFAGNIYAADTGNNRIEKFDKEGKFITSFGEMGVDAGRMLAPRGVVVDNSSGYLYVTGADNKVSKFDAVVRFADLSLSSKAISPNGDGIHDQTTIDFDLSELANVNLDIYDSSGQNMVASPYSSLHIGAGINHMVWDGKDSSRKVVGDGRYLFKLSGRTPDDVKEALPFWGEITVDQAPPVISDIQIPPDLFTPNGDGVDDTVQISFTVSETSDAYVVIRSLDGSEYKTIKLSNVAPSKEIECVWDGKSERSELKEGSYNVYIKAVDLAGNESKEFSGGQVALELGKFIIAVAAFPEVMSQVIADPRPIELNLHVASACSVEAAVYSGATEVRRLILKQGFAKGEFPYKWDGKDNNSNLVKEGSYNYVFKAQTPLKSEDKSGILRIDNSPPIVTNAKISPDTVQLGQSSVLSYHISETASVRIELLDDYGAVVSVPVDDRSEHPGDRSINIQTSGLIAGKGYKIRIRTQDDAGNVYENSPVTLAVISGFSILEVYDAPDPFSPNGDALNDLAWVHYKLAGGVGDVRVTLKIMNLAGGPVKKVIDDEISFLGSHSDYWDGTSDTGWTPADGEYIYRIEARDSLGNTAVEEGRLTLARNPTLTIYADPPTFSPNGDGRDDQTVIHFSLNYLNLLTGEGFVTINIYDPGGNVIHSFTQACAMGSYTHPWNGKDGMGNIVADGTYKVEVIAQDPIGTVNAQALNIKVVSDIVPPVITISGVAPAMITPNADGVDDETLIQYLVTDESASIGVQVSIYNSQTIFGPSTLVRRLNGDKNGNTIWDGTVDVQGGNGDSNNDNIADKGLYAFVINAVDDSGNTSEARGGPITVDKVLLTIENPSNNPNPVLISPNGDGVKDYSEISFRLTTSMDASTPVYAKMLSDKTKIGILSGPYVVGKVTIKIKDSNNNVMRTLMDAVPCVKDLTYVATWDGRDSGGMIVPDGKCTIEVTAVDLAGSPARNSLISGVTSGFASITSDVTPPAITISNPVNGSWRRGRINIRVTIQDANPGNYSAGYGTSRNNITSGSGAKTNEVIGSWETTGINGTFDINLLASDLAGNTAEAKVVCNVDNTYPVISGLTFEVNTVKRKDFNPYLDSGGITVKFSINDNSFNGGSYTVPVTGINSSVEVITTGSARVKAFANNSSLPQGQQQFIWTGLNDSADYVNEGAYPFEIIVKDSAGNSVKTSAEAIALWDDQRLTANSFVSDYPRIDKNSSDVHIAWEDNRNGNKEIYYKRSINSGVTWEDGQGNLNTDRRITNSGIDDWRPIIKANGVNIHLTEWVPPASPPTSPTIYDCRSLNKGNSWTMIKSFGSGYASNGSICINGNNIHLTYDDYDGVTLGVARLFYARSTDNGASWSGASLIAPASDSWRMSMAANGNNVHVVWYDTRVSYSAVKIYYRRSTNNGSSWDNGAGSNSDRLLSNGAAMSMGGQLAINGSNLHVVWYDNRDGNYEIYYKRSTDNGATWDDGSGTVNGERRLTNNSADSRMPAIGVNGNTVNVVWQDNRDGNNEMYLKRSIDNGVTWSPDIRVTHMTGDSINPTIAMDANNDSFAVWSDSRDGNQEIYFQKIPPNFAPVTSPMMTALYFDGGGKLVINSISEGTRDHILTVSREANLVIERLGHDMRFVSGEALLSGQGPIVSSPSLTIDCISPRDGVTVSTLRPEFKWHGLKGFMDYRIECAKASDEASLSSSLDYFNANISYDQALSDRPVGAFAIPAHQTGLDESTDVDPLWYWRVKAISGESIVGTSEPASFSIQLPISISGVISYPNPFNPDREKTRIRYRLGRRVDEVTIRIYDITGALVKELEGDTRAEGSSIWNKYNEVEWDGRNGRGDMVRNGVYPFEVRVSSGGKRVSERGKIVVLK